MLYHCICAPLFQVRARFESGRLTRTRLIIAVTTQDWDVVSQPFVVTAKIRHILPYQPNDGDKHVCDRGVEKSYRDIAKGSREACECARRNVATWR